MQIRDAFGGTYLETFILVLLENGTKIQLKDVDQKFYCSDYYDVSVSKYGVKCGISLRFWENKGWINEIDTYGCFQWYFRYRLDRIQKMMKAKLIDGKEL